MIGAVPAQIVLPLRRIKLGNENGAKAQTQGHVGARQDPVDHERDHDLQENVSPLRVFHHLKIGHGGGVHGAVAEHHRLGHPRGAAGMGQQTRCMGIFDVIDGGLPGPQLEEIPPVRDDGVGLPGRLLPPRLQVVARPGRQGHRVRDANGNHVGRAHCTGRGNHLFPEQVQGHHDPGFRLPQVLHKVVPLRQHVEEIHNRSDPVQGVKAHHAGHRGDRHDGHHVSRPDAESQNALAARSICAKSSPKEMRWPK